MDRMYNSFHSVLLLSPFAMFCVLCGSENLHVAAEKRTFPLFLYPTLQPAVYISLCGSLVNPLLSQPWAVINSNAWQRSWKSHKTSQATDWPTENAGKGAKLTITYQVSEAGETLFPAFFHLQSTQTQLERPKWWSLLTLHRAFPENPFAQWQLHWENVAWWSQSWWSVF